MAIIHFIQAGGTIDKDYVPQDGNHGYNFIIGESAFFEISRRAGMPYAVAFTCVCQKDSLDMTDDDRGELKRIAANVPEKKVIILHGTDTIHVTAKHLSDIAGKTVVLTGAMKPAKFRDSDADFNVGMAVGAVHSLKPGIYIALYGRVVRWDRIVPKKPPQSPFRSDGGVVFYIKSSNIVP